MAYERPPTNPFQNPPNIIYEHKEASLRAQAKQLFGNENIWVKMHPCIAWDKVDNPSPQSTPQVLPSFKVYTPPVTYPEEVDETIGIPMEVEPLDHRKLEDLGLNTYNHDIPLSSREIPSVDEPKPQLLPNFSPLDVNLGDKRGTDPPINPYSLGRKAYLLKDKQIPSEGYLMRYFSFGRHLEELLGLIWRTNRQDYRPTPTLIKNFFIVAGDGVTDIIQSDKETKSSSTKDKSPSHPSGSTPVVPEMHKEKQQAAGDPASLGATSEERSLGATRCDASADSTAEADPGKSAPNDSIPHQQGMDEGTKNYAPGHIFARTNLSFLVDQTKSTEDGLKTTHTNLGTNEESRYDEISKKIKLEDLSDLMKDTRFAFFTPDSPQDEHIIVLDESEEFLDLPSQVSSFQEKLKTLDFLTSLLNKVANTLNRFAIVMENALGLATASPVEGEKNTNPTTKDVKTTNLHNELVNLMGIDVVTQYYNKKLLYDKYCDKMLKRKEKGWKTIYGLIKTRMEYLNQTEKELKFDFNKPLKEQDPLNELNYLVNKKRKRTGDLKDHSRSTKKHKSSVQHEEEVH
ncbi:hypothetical protein Tco_0577603 [Tanacetum coccineum]